MAGVIGEVACRGGPAANGEVRVQVAPVTPTLQRTGRTAPFSRHLEECQETSTPVPASK